MNLRPVFLVFLLLWLPAFSADGETIGIEALRACQRVAADIDLDHEAVLTECGSAAEFGYPEADNRLGRVYLEGPTSVRNRDLAEFYFSRASEKGYAPAQTNLGMIYYSGRSGDRDPSRAAHWFERAARQGDAHAQFNLGLMLEQGDGVTEDVSEAVYWYRASAGQGNVHAQVNLGNIYAEGRGVAANSAQALKWWSQAARQGSAVAEENILRLRDSSAHHTGVEKGPRRPNLNPNYIQRVQGYADSFRERPAGQPATEPPAEEFSDAAPSAKPPTDVRRVSTPAGGFPGFVARVQGDAPSLNADQLEELKNQYFSEVVLPRVTGTQRQRSVAHATVRSAFDSAANSWIEQYLDDHSHGRTISDGDPLTLSRKAASTNASTAVPAPQNKLGTQLIIFGAPLVFAILLFSVATRSERHRFTTIVRRVLFVVAFLAFAYACTGGHQFRVVEDKSRCFQGHPRGVEFCDDL